MTPDNVFSATRCPGLTMEIAATAKGQRVQSRPAAGDVVSSQTAMVVDCPSPAVLGTINHGLAVTVTMAKVARSSHPGPPKGVTDPAPTGAHKAMYSCLRRSLQHVVSGHGKSPNRPPGESLSQPQPHASNVLSTAGLRTCPACSAFHTSTTTRPWPFFVESPGSISLYNFDPTVILPFKIISQNKKTADPSTRLNSVYQIWIHPAHHNFSQTNQKNVFALKKLHSTGLENFKRETRALQAFAARPHEHIVKLLTAFRHDNVFYLLFPWAVGGSLRSFWRAHPQPAANSAMTTWVAEQSLGIATALHILHHESTKLSGQRRAAVEMRGYHGDIKAENILLFESDRYGDRHIWKLGDFGVSKKFHVTSHGGDVPCGFTPTYQSPEHRIEGRIDDRADIWALGCVLLETVVWLFRGWAGLVELVTARTRTSEEVLVRQNCFFDLVDSSSRAILIPVLKPSVTRYIESLHDDPFVTPYLKDLLHLIHHYLLDVNKQSRLSSELVVETLRQLYQRCVDVPAYTVPIPRPRKPPLLAKPVHSKNSNNCVVGFSAASNPLTSRTTSCTVPPDWASCQDTSSRTIPHRGLTMARESSATSSSQWLDDFINQQLHDTQTGLHSSTQEMSHEINLSSISQETRLLPPNPFVIQPSRRRDFSCISDPDGEDSHQRSKFRKLGGVPRENWETSSPPTGAFVSSQLAKTPYATCLPIKVSESKLFACPFLKRPDKNISTTKDWKCCLGPGPGWTIHRLKEHIHRKHSSSNYQCHRCFAEFKNSSSLEKHQRSAVPCAVRTKIGRDTEKIDAQQALQLKKKLRRVSEEEKWNEIYRIIFRLDPRAELPSPYHENIAPAPDIEPGPVRCDDSLSQFQSYLQDRLQDCHKGQHNASTIQACIDLVQSFQNSSGDHSFMSCETPSLLFDCGTLSTTSHTDCQPGTASMRLAPDETSLETFQELEGISTDDLGGTVIWNPEFEAQFDQTFGLSGLDVPAKPEPIWRDRPGGTPNNVEDGTRMFMN